MNTLNKLLDKAREKCSANSDAKVAKTLKVSRQTISKWRKNELRITDEHLALLIEIANADATMFAKVREEKADTTTEQRIWKSMLERLTATAATLLVGVGITSPPTPQTHALNKNFSNVISHNAYYVHVEKVGARTAV
ncbi:hypothetical protein B9J09_05410 [Xylella fastidiosa subsp. pauca]|uniref:DUF3693 domain-containing protein n=1 Tax=Xylella fastidiosa TaxID=2371 RepID=UPI000765A197|nr:DUF3693 domain-containing protein [Xylella fastidiosa]ARO68540.1 hypothetical protein B9J09_05410 [Xylella fastidiosa subsp. pauca]AVI20649.1 hypothetical protein BCV75_05015 [Xylella fastidiosa]AVI22673.1 hypothetical protein BC375_05075 [Xylella fastidiosa]KXB11098.1 hypothetical protein ADT32_06640 [Xylella fastidiosa]KXB11112.1 hypothetical protein ADT33_10340 [Xylella fastidiosa]